MKIEVFLCVWNEIDILEKVIQHHYEYADKVTILDNYSTDGSAELAIALNCEVIQYGNKFFDDSENQKIKNNIWKGSDADYVVVSDCDEVPVFFGDGYSPNLNSYTNVDFEMARDTGATIFRTRGWQIMSNDMPKEELVEITNGYEFSNYAKSIVFNPKAINEINYNPGAHLCNPVGDVRWYKPDWYQPELYVLHYKHIGGVERTIKRYKEYQKRMSPYNRKHGHGRHYNQNERMLRREWDERMKISKPLL